MDNELMHYGVPGMKWGVRKSEYRSMNRSQRKATKTEYKKQYKADKRQAYDMKEKAKTLSAWDKAYDSTLKNQNKLQKRYADKEVKKHGQTTDKSKDWARANAELAKATKLVQKNSQKQISDTKQFIAEMKQKYGNKSVKDLKTHTKNGREYTKKYMGSTRFVVEPYMRKDKNGNKHIDYRPVIYKVRPVATSI